MAFFRATRNFMIVLTFLFAMRYADKKLSHIDRDFSSWEAGFDSRWARHTKDCQNPSHADNLLSFTCNILRKPDNLLSKMPFSKALRFREIIREIISAFTPRHPPFWRRRWHR